MKQLVVVALLALTACTGCESTPPAPTKLPPLPAELRPQEKTKPVVKVKVTPATKFGVGDKVTMESPDGKTTVDGVILEVGPVVTWINPVTKEEIESRAYLVQITVDGKAQRGPAPEFALTRRN